jgi:hypothetical protein
MARDEQMSHISQTSQTPQTPTPGHVPVVFDDAPFQEDLAYTNVTGIAVARMTRHRYENGGGIPIGELRLTEERGPDGTILPRCLKVYLPPPDGPFGMVFRLIIDNDTGAAHLRYLAFGQRRPPASG